MTANMWKNCLKNVESDNNEVLYETLLDYFSQRNSTYCLNKPRIHIRPSTESKAAIREASICLKN